VLGQTTKTGHIYWSFMSRELVQNMPINMDVGMIFKLHHSPFGVVFAKRVGSTHTSRKDSTTVTCASAGLGLQEGSSCVHPPSAPLHDGNASESIPSCHLVVWGALGAVRLAALASNLGPAGGCFSRRPAPERTPEVRRREARRRTNLERTRGLGGDVCQPPLGGDARRRRGRAAGHGLPPQLATRRMATTS
jgi:hypothetical protein